MSVAGAALGTSLALVALGAWAATTRAALRMLHPGQRRRLAEGTAGERRTLALWERRGALLPTLRALILLSWIGAAACLALALFTQRPAWLPAVPLIGLPVLLLATDLLPDLVASRFAPQLLRYGAWPLRLLHALSAPLRLPAEAARRLGRRLLGGAPARLPGTHTEASLRMLLDHGAASGAVDPIERDIIEAVFDFDELTVDRLMTPRPDIRSIPLTIEPDTLLERCRAIHHSRIPVHAERADHIVGVLLQKDLLKHRRAPLDGPRQLQSLLLPPVFVPASRAADAMLREFLTKRFHMAFVVDEHGGLLGLITLNDLLQELVGDLDGETDGAEIARISPEFLTVKASIDLQEFIDETGIALPQGGYRTLGGFILHHLGRLPRAGDRIELQGVALQVLSMEGRRVSEVAVHLPVGPPREVAG